MLLSYSSAGRCDLLSVKNPIDRGAWQAIVYGVARVGHD